MEKKVFAIDKRVQECLSVVAICKDDTSIYPRVFLPKDKMKLA